MSIKQFSNLPAEHNTVVKTHFMSREKFINSLGEHKTVFLDLLNKHKTVFKTCLMSIKQF